MVERFPDLGLQMKPKPTHDWVKNPEMKKLILRAWEEYEHDPQYFRLYRYFDLIDEAYYEIAPEEFKPWNGSDDQQPSLKDMY
jgi:hypothetical protein